jgi:spermidine/putrescine transport system permease protein
VPAEANVIASAVFLLAILIVLVVQIAGAIKRRKLAKTN